MPNHNKQPGGCGELYPGADYTPEEVEFMLAMNRYKREKRRPYPTWCEVLDVLRSLGWTKVLPEPQSPRG